MTKTTTKNRIQIAVATTALIVLLFSMVGFPTMSAYADTGYSRDRFGSQIQINSSKNTMGSVVTWSCTGAAVSVGASQGGVSVGGIQLAYYRVSSVTLNVAYTLNGKRSQQSYTYNYIPKGYASGSQSLSAGATNIQVTCTATFVPFPPPFILLYIFHLFYPSSTFSATCYY